MWDWHSKQGRHVRMILWQGYDVWVINGRLHRHSSLIGHHELGRSRLCPDFDFRPAFDAEIDARIAVAINVLDQMLELDIHIFKISSHGSHTALSSSNISNASSSFLRSHTVRALILFGFGIRPSFTSWSNREGLIPI